MVSKEEVKFPIHLWPPQLTEQPIISESVVSGCEPHRTLETTGPQYFITTVIIRHGSQDLVLLGGADSLSIRGERKKSINMSAVDYKKSIFCVFMLYFSTAITSVISNNAQSTQECCIIYAVHNGGQVKPHLAPVYHCHWTEVCFQLTVQLPMFLNHFLHSHEIITTNVLTPTPPTSFNIIWWWLPIQAV